MLDDIKDYFARLAISSNAAFPLKDEESDEKVFIYKLDKVYGVAIEYKGDPFYQRFSSVVLQDARFFFDGSEDNYLTLTTEKQDMLFDFAYICSDFLDLGKNNIRRKNLIQNPSIWCSELANLLGDSVKSITPFAVLGELIVYYYFLKQGKDVKWNGPDSNSHDLEYLKNNIEVKSSTLKSETKVKIASQFQLESKDTLYLYFCRFEKTDINGISINDLVDKITALIGSDKDLEVKLFKLGYKCGIPYRKEKYKVLEISSFLVNDSFPRIVQRSFKEDKIPDCVQHISYELDLSSITHQAVNMDFLKN